MQNAQQELFTLNPARTFTTNQTAARTIYTVTQPSTVSQPAIKAANPTMTMGLTGNTNIVMSSGISMSTSVENSFTKYQQKEGLVMNTRTTAPKMIVGSNLSSKANITGQQSNNNLIDLASQAKMRTTRNGQPQMFAGAPGYSVSRSGAGGDISVQKNYFDNAKVWTGKA